MAGVFAESRKLIELGELGRFGVDGKCRDRALLAGFVGGVGKLSAGVNDDPGGITRFGGDAFRRQFAGLGVEFERVDALACGFAGVRADKGEKAGVRRGFACKSGETEEGCGRT